VKASLTIPNFRLTKRTMVNLPPKCEIETKCVFDATVSMRYDMVIHMKSKLVKYIYKMLQNGKELIFELKY